MISALDLFRIGIGPSSSHTVGPIRIVGEFLHRLQREETLGQVARIAIELQGSLALTGAGHGTPDACIIGLCGWDAETLEPATVYAQVEEIKTSGSLPLNGSHMIAFDYRKDLVLACDVIPSLHPNGMVVQAYDPAGKLLSEGEYYSTGGGFYASAETLRSKPVDDLIQAGLTVPNNFGSAEELLAICAQRDLSIAEIIAENETVFRDATETLAGLDRIIDAMMACIDAGLDTEGNLPGDLQVSRRASKISKALVTREFANEAESLMDWLNVYAMAVNEENAAGGRVVTAPTNGAAGIIPSVMRYYCQDDEVLDREKARILLLTATGIGLLYKQRASISGAEMGCQGEVGVACSMAAAGLAAVWGGSPEQVATAAEIGMEHNLGLTCDPVGGLVQIPCIERNALAAVKAVNAARLALHAGAEPRVSLDQVIETMRQTGLDMSNKYKETSLGGLAVNVIAC